MIQHPIQQVGTGLDDAPRTFIHFRPAECKVFRKRRRLAGPQWMVKNLYVPIGSRKGLYSHKNNPAMYGVLDWATRHHVRTVVLAKGIQIGGTVAFYGLLLREGDYTSDSALIVMADEKTGKKLVKKRLQPMIDKSPALAGIKSTDPDDTTLYSITLANGYTIDIGWASSEMSVSSESYRVVILDEISKYKATGNIEDAKARTTVYPDTCRIWILSSPGIDSDDPEHRDPLMVEAEACDIMLEFRAKCPDCGGLQVMRFDQFKWPEQATLDGKVENDPKAIRRNKSAYYQCEHCPSQWNDYKRDKAVLSAMEDGWQPTDGEDIEFPQSVYIHFPAWLSPFVSLSTVVAEWLEAQGDEEKLRKWYNRYAGVSYVRKGKEIAPELASLKDRVENYAPIVPMEAGLLTAGVDIQQDRIEVEIIAWGEGRQSWGMAYEVFEGDTSLLDVYEQLDRFLLTEWEHESGETIRISRTFVDSGYRQNNVAKFCAPRRPRGVYAIKGASVEDAPELQGPTRQKAGGIHFERFLLGGNALKTLLFGDLEINQPGPGFCHIPDTYPEVWFEMMQAEHNVMKRVGSRSIPVWVKKKAGLRNESIDLRQYALAAMLSMRVNIKALVAGFKLKQQERQQQTKKPTASRPRGGFVSNY